MGGMSACSDSVVLEFACNERFTSTASGSPYISFFSASSWLQDAQGLGRIGMHGT